MTETELNVMAALAQIGLISRVLPFDSVRLKDGSVAKFNDLLMRRRLSDGLWEYRLPTDAEAYEEWIDSQW